MKITKTQLRQIIKEEVQKELDSGESLQELFGMFGGGKKKSQPKSKAGASKSSDNQKMLHKIFNKGRTPDKKELLMAFKESPEAYVSAVRLAAKGVSGAGNRNTGQVEEYLKYIQILNNRYQNSSYVTGKRNTKDPMGDISVRFLTDNSEANNPGAREAHEVDSGNQSNFGDKAAKFVDAMKSYASDENDFTLNYLVQKAEKS